jgi:hypothetical protein
LSARASSIAALFFALALVSANAAISYTGVLLQDDEEPTFSFTVAAPVNVLFQTFGYAGGTNGNGMAIPPGGFDPVLSLFDSTGLLLAVNDDNPSAPVDPTTGAGRDSLISLILTTGNYTLVLTQSDNFPVGPDLAAGFTRTGQGNFTGPAFIGSPGSFWDVTPAQRNGAWALDITGNGVTVSGVPEPGTLGTLSLGFGGLLFLFKRRKCQSLDA